jgi:hypothetical protein
MNNNPVTNEIPPVIVPSLPDNAGPTIIIESLLKRPAHVIGQARLPNPGRLAAWLMVVIVLSVAVYGVLVGTFSGGQQFWAAPVKLIIGTVASAMLCLPSLYMAACLSGRDVKVMEVAGYLLAAVALSSLLLLGFAPAAWLFSVSTSSIMFMGGLHLFIWFVGTLAGLRLLSMALGNGRFIFSGHLLLWCLIFMLVCLQMTTTLRPLLGSSKQFLTHEKKFFVEHWWDCAQ